MAALDRLYRPHVPCVALLMLASTDALTGLANRRAYEDEAGRRWAEASDPPRALGIGLFGIERFKRFDDTAGHAVGDRCPVAIAGEICRILPALDFCARYGGEAFISLLHDAPPRAAAHLAEALRAAVEALSRPNPGTGGCVTVSLGVALAAPDRRPASPGDLVTAADAARPREGGQPESRRRRVGRGPAGPPCEFAPAFAPASTLVSGPGPASRAALCA